MPKSTPKSKVRRSSTRKSAAGKDKGIEKSKSQDTTESPLSSEIRPVEFSPDGTVDSQRMQLMLSRLCHVQRGLSDAQWEELSRIQVALARDATNYKGQSTRAYLALLEQRKVDQSALKTAIDCMAQAKLMHSNNGTNDGSEQLSSGAIAGLLTQLAAATIGKDSNEESIPFGPAMGGTVEAVGFNFGTGSEMESGPLATHSATGTDDELLDMR